MPVQAIATGAGFIAKCRNFATFGQALGKPQHGISCIRDRTKEPDFTLTPLVSHRYGNRVLVDVQSNVSRFVHLCFSFEPMHVRQKTTLAARAPQNAHLV
jgi:hypothetical protein